MALYLHPKLHYGDEPVFYGEALATIDVLLVDRGIYGDAPANFIETWAEVAVDRHGRFPILILLVATVSGTGRYQEARPEMPNWIFNNFFVMAYEITLGKLIKGGRPTGSSDYPKIIIPPTTRQELLVWWDQYGASLQTPPVKRCRICGAPGVCQLHVD